MIIERIVGPDRAGCALRDYLNEEFGFSTRLLRRLKANLLITINGGVGYTNIILRAGDLLRIDLSGLAAAGSDSFGQSRPGVSRSSRYGVTRIH